jgi:putative ABC transport system permease protein
MLWYKLKLSVRSLAKDKLNSFINIFGLAIGMAAVILITVFIQYEMSFDKFNSKYDRIHRLVSQMGKETAGDNAICRRINHEEYKENIPGLEEITQLYRGWECEIHHKDKRFFGFNFHFVDDNFTKVFDIDFLHGNPLTALEDTKSVVLSEKAAKTIFGKTDVLGTLINLNGVDCTISGVAKDLPKNSHYSFEVLAPLEYVFPVNSKSGLEFFTYALVKEGADQEACLNSILKEYRKSIDQFQEYGYKTGAYFQKLSDVHLHSAHMHSIGPKGNYEIVLIYIFLAILILSIAIINFINIMTVQYEGKIKEIGMRKTIGATRWQLIRLFVGKSILLTSIALILGVILAEIFLPYFKQLVYRDLMLAYSSNLLLSIGLPVLALVVGILSGVYPAIFISRPSPSVALQGGGLKMNGKNILTKVLVIFQFTVSITLIASLFVLNKQVDYLKNADLGFNPEKVLAIENMNAKIHQSYFSIKEELLKLPLIRFVSASDHIPGGGTSGQGFKLMGQEENKYKSFNSYRIQPDYFKTTGVELSHGRSFKETGKMHEKGIIINETGAKLLKQDDVIGLNVEYKGQVQEIIGVVKDFHFQSLRHKVKPLMFTHNSFGQLYDILIRYEGNDLQQVLEEVTNVIRKFDPGYVLDYTIIEKLNRNKYRSEERAMEFMSYSSIISLVLALLGLYSLSLFMVQKRIKEIGIRKVNGATEWQISSLLFTTFIKWLGIAFLIAVPIAWMIMNSWLKSFAYKVEIGVLPFIIAGLITALFALATVGRQTWKAANQNPVESLRYE